MNEIKNEILQSKDFLIAFLKQPFKEIKNIPDWSWRRLLILQILITMASGALSGFLSQSILAVFTMPILTLMMLFVTCFFFYYTFQIFADKTLSFRQLFATVFFANIPFFIFNIISSYVSPITLVGFAFSAFLLIVAFVDRHQLPKKIVIRIISTMYALILVLWILGRIDGSRADKAWRSQKLEAPEVHLGQ